MKNMNFAAISDITPNRCNIEYVGSEEDCNAYVEDYGNDTWLVLPVDDEHSECIVGLRGWHDRSTVWTNSSL